MNSSRGQLSSPPCLSWLPVAPMAALGFALAWRRPRHGFLLLPCPRYKASHRRHPSSFPPLFFPAAPPSLRRAFAVDLAPLPSRQSLSRLHLFLAHPANQPWSLDFTEERRSLPFFLAPGNTAVAFVSPWPVLHGTYLSLLCSPSASLCYRDSL